MRFGPLQPATASAHSGMEAKAQWHCGVWSVDSNRFSGFGFYFLQCLVSFLTHVW